MTCIHACTDGHVCCTRLCTTWLLS